MDTAIDRNKIHAFIDRADERILRIFSAIMHSEEKEMEQLSDEHKSIINERITEYKTDKNQSMALEETIHSIKEKYGF